MENYKTPIADLIKEVHDSGKLVPDLMRCENGNNFRAISEKAILDVLNPILDKHHIHYTVRVDDEHLEIKEAYGAKGKKLQFIATMKVTLCFATENLDLGFCTQSVGMGIDDNDKAMGKAYTYAIKYALLKLFRLCYGDDPDYEVSTPLLTEPKAHAKAESIKAAKADEKKSHGKPLPKGEPASEKQMEYIRGLEHDKSVPEEIICMAFNKKNLNNLTKSEARDIIKWLQEYDETKSEDYLPF